MECLGKMERKDKERYTQRIYKAEVDVNIRETDLTRDETKVLKNLFEKRNLSF